MKQEDKRKFLDKLMEHAAVSLKATRLDPEAFKTQASISINTLGDVDASVLFEKLLYCAQIGMIPNIHAALTKFKGKPQVMIMASGVKEFAQRMPGCFIGQPIVVREGDDFEHSIDMDGSGDYKATIRYSNKTFGSGEVKCVFVVYRRPVDIDKPDGKVILDVVVLGTDYIEKVKRVATAGRRSSPWSEWADEMACKTAVKKCHKMMPGVSAEIMQRLDDHGDVVMADPESAEVDEEDRELADVVDAPKRPAKQAKAPEPAPEPIPQDNPGEPEANGGQSLKDAFDQ